MSEFDELHASKQGVDSLSSAEYWRRVCPHLHVGDAEVQAGVQGQTREVASPADCTEVRRRLLDEGFAALPPSALEWSVDIPALAEGARALARHGWPPTFLVIYDEAWVMAMDACKVMEKATGNTLCMDIVGFLVDPAISKGFSPHRDRQPEDWTPRGVPAAVSSTFKADGMAKYVTLWAALTDASPENSCLHFVPRACDPGYLDGDPEEDELEAKGDPMQRCFPNKDAFQHIRCAPVAAGGCTFHTHRAIHWGSTGRASYRGGPRIALSFGFSTQDFEPAYFSHKSLPFPPLRLRLALASAQVLNYATLSAGDSKGWAALAGSLAGCGPATLTLLHRLFQKQAKAFHPTYRKEIAQKFVRVSLDLVQGSTVASSCSTSGHSGSTAAAGPTGAAPTSAAAAAAPDDDEDDDALEAMLDAEADAGEVLFHDDFDLLNAGQPGHGTMKALGRKGSRRRRAASVGPMQVGIKAHTPAKKKRKLTRPW